MALVDSGAGPSAIHRRVLKNVHPQPKLIRKTNIQLETSNGTSLGVIGETEIELKIGGQTIRQTFVVCTNLNRNIILGRNWMRRNGVRVYMDLDMVRVNGEYLPLEEDNHISSIVRLEEQVILKPQHMHTCKGRTSLKGRVGEIFEVEQLKAGYLGLLAGVSVANAVIKKNSERRLPLVIVNNTNQTVTLKEGCPVARIYKTGSINAISPTNGSAKGATNEELEQVGAPEEFRRVVDNVLKKNRDLFVTRDKDLGRTDTVKMRIDTGDHPPIKKRPYRIPLKQRKIVDQAIDEMLEAKVIERSRSAWGFPVILVEKKDGTKRFCIDFRALNKISKGSATPLPVIDDILASLGSARYFSKLDLKAGYWQVGWKNLAKKK